MVSLFSALKYTLKQNASGTVNLRKKEKEENEDGETVFYRCKKCGETSFSIGFLHGHMEEHTSFLNVADVDSFMDRTEKVVVLDEKTRPVTDLQGENL